MKIDELMIGNYIQDMEGNIYKTFSFSSILIQCDKIEGGSHIFEDEEVKPIPLTEEWLIKFGFISESSSGWFDLKDIGINFKENRMTQEAGRFYGQFKIPEFVQQLQNLYFALTGEKLKLKE